MYKEAIITYWVNNEDSIEFVKDIKNDKSVVRMSILYSDDEMTCFRCVKRLYYAPSKKD